MTATLRFGLTTSQTGVPTTPGTPAGDYATNFAAIDAQMFADMGLYDPAHNYMPNDLVQFNSQLWRCRLACTGITPAVGVSQWTALTPDVVSFLASLTIAEAPAQVAALSNIAALTGTPTIGTYATQRGDRILLLGQTTPSQDGLWQIPLTGGAWVRPVDFAHGANVAGKIVQVEDGTTWALPSLVPVVVDTTAQAWIQLADTIVVTAVKTANYAASNLQMVPVDASAGSVTITVPAAVPGGQVIVQKVDTSFNTVLVKTQGGATLATLILQDQRVDARSDAATWRTPTQGVPAIAPIGGTAGTSPVLNSHGTIDWNALAALALTNIFTAPQYFSGIPFLDVESFRTAGMSDDALFTAVAAGLPAGGCVLSFDAYRAYSINAHLSITQPCIVRLNGAKITQNAAGDSVFRVTSSGVRIVKGNGKLIGPSGTVSNGLSSAIVCQGASAAAPLVDIELSDMSITGFGQCAIELNYVTGWRTENVNVSNVYYAGLLTRSAINGHVEKWDIDTVNAPFSSGTGYGMAFSRNNADSLTTDPRSANITVSHFRIQGVNWEGFDSHGGQAIDVQAGQIYGCNKGVVFTESLNASSVSTFACQDCTVSDVVIDSLVTDGSAGIGVLVNGAGTVLGTPTELATNCRVLAVTVRNHGLHSGVNSGGIVLYNTQSAQVHDCDLYQCSPFGVLWYHDNYGGSDVGNTFTDIWSSSGAVGESAAIEVSSDYNTLTIGSYTINLPGKKTGVTYLCTRGVEIANQSHNFIRMGVEGRNESPIPFVDPGNRASAKIQTYLDTVAADVGVMTVGSAATAGAVGKAADVGHTHSLRFVSAAKWWDD